VVGVDLSPGRFKVVALAAGEDGPELVGLVDESTADEAPERAFDGDKVAARLRKALDGMGVEPREVAIALGPAEAVVRRLAVVPQPREATLAALALQLAPALGPDVAAPRVDYKTLQAAASGGRVAVLAAAGRADAVAAQTQAVTEAGFQVGPVVPAGAALAVTWRTLAPAHAAGRVLLLHVGESAVLWMLIEDGEPIALDAPLVGVASLRNRAGAQRGGGVVPGDPEAVAEWVARIRQEVQRGLQAAKREAGQAEAAADPEVWLCGGGARIPGFREALSESLLASVNVFDPFSSRADEMPGSGFGPALLPAVGAALQALAPGQAEQELDLRSEHDSAAGAKKIPLAVLGRGIARDRAWRYVALAAVGGWLAAFTVGARHGEASEALGLRETQVVQDSAKVANAMAQNQALVSRRGELGSAVEHLQRLERARRLWLGVLDVVAVALPGTAWVSAIAEEREDPVTGGIAVRVRGFAPSDLVASSLQARLADADLAPAAGGAQTQMVTIGSVTAVEFEITVEVGIDNMEAMP
jgi:type IV pilus assembly protein PilM